jgi:hypothetical protein
MARLLDEVEDASYMEDKVTVAKLQMTMDKKNAKHRPTDLPVLSI